MHTVIEPVVVWYKFTLHNTQTSLVYLLLAILPVMSHRIMCDAVRCLALQRDTHSARVPAGFCQPIGRQFDQQLHWLLHFPPVWRLRAIGELKGETQQWLWVMFVVVTWCHSFTSCFLLSGDEMIPLVLLYQDGMFQRSDWSVYITVNWEQKSLWSVLKQTLFSCFSTNLHVVCSLHIISCFTVRWQFTAWCFRVHDIAVVSVPVQAVVLGHGSGEDPLRDQSSAHRRRPENASRWQQHQDHQEQQDGRQQQQSGLTSPRLRQLHQLQTLPASSDLWQLPLTRFHLRVLCLTWLLYKQKQR